MNANPSPSGTAEGATIECPLPLFGFATLAAGLLSILFYVLHAPEGEFATAEVVLFSAWALVHTLGVASAILTMLSLVGLYLLQRQKSGVLGFTGFVLAFAGTLFLGAGAFLDGYFVPALAAVDPRLILDTGPLLTPPAVLAFLIPKLVFFVPGFLILLFVSWRSSLLPKPPLLILAAGVILIDALVAPRPVITVGGVLFGIGQIWIGWSLVTAPER